MLGDSRDNRGADVSGNSTIRSIVGVLSRMRDVSYGGTR